MNNLKKIISDIFFPNRCPFCNSFIKWDSLCCDKCREELPYIDGNYHNNCSKDSPYNKLFCCFYYKDSVKKSLLALKESKASNTCSFFATILSQKIKYNNYTYDYIMPVPMSKKKKRFRGYNQSEVLARELSYLLGIPFLDNVLTKNDSVKEQHSLTKNERQEFAEKSFTINNKLNIKNKKILLCDDIYTTGSTVKQCTSLLLSAGVSNVDVAVMAITMNKEEIL